MPRPRGQITDFDFLTGSWTVVHRRLAHRWVGSDEWDVFEGTILSNVEHYASEHPHAPDPQGRLEQRRAWHRAQQRWGRECFGFGLYLLKKD